MTPVPVWDPLIRIGHWALVASMVLGWATTFIWFDAHQPVGWVAAAVVAVRLAWGFAGPRHARFAGFVRGPRATWRYARAAIAGREPRHLGHNPLGGWMVLALLAVVLGLALTGWLYTTDRFWGDATVERVHVALAWAMVVMAALHVAGVVLESVRQRENLVAAMVHGRKRAPAPGDVE